MDNDVKGLGDKTKTRVKKLQKLLNESVTNLTGTHDNDVKHLTHSVGELANTTEQKANELKTQLQNDVREKVGDVNTSLINAHRILNVRGSIDNRFASAAKA